MEFAKKREYQTTFHTYRKEAVVLLFIIQKTLFSTKTAI